MRLARQRAARDLVPQDIDYGALGVPVIFPDDYLAPNADPDRRMSRAERLTATVMTPVLALHMALTGDGDWFGDNPLDIHDHTEVPRNADDVKREDLLLGVLREIDGEFGAEDMEVAVAFGALHIPTVVRELVKLGYRVTPGAQWLTAIDYDEPPHLRRPPLDGLMTGRPGAEAEKVAVSAPGRRPRMLVESACRRSGRPRRWPVRHLSAGPGCAAATKRAPDRLAVQNGHSS